ncbi:hypothetical protein [Kocuria dechangensis]|nr:hypothetical protein [Kocuria dechangensis]
MTTPTATPGLGGYRESVTLEFSRLAASLRICLGAQLVAYLGGVGETRAVRQWATGRRRPSQVVEQRLRLAYQVAGVITEATSSPSALQAWFQGANPALGDRSPARMLRDYPVDEVSVVVLAAARAFVATARCSSMPSQGA